MRDVGRLHDFCIQEISACFACMQTHKQPTYPSLRTHSYTGFQELECVMSV